MAAVSYTNPISNTIVNPTNVKSNPMDNPRIQGNVKTEILPQTTNVTQTNSGDQHNVARPPELISKHRI